QEAKGLPGLEWIELPAVGIEASHRLGCKAGGQCWIHELTTELEVSAESEVELLAKLAQVESGACLKCEVEKAPIHRSDPHATAQFVVVGEAESRYPPR